MVLFYWNEYSSTAFGRCEPKFHLMGKVIDPKLSSSSFIKLKKMSPFVVDAEIMTAKRTFSMPLGLDRPGFVSKHMVSFR
jgi:hypothetical protein